MKETKIEFGILNFDFFLKTYGHITANVCFNLKNFLFKKFSELDNNYNFYLDLEDTDYMDSTFIGLIIGLEKKINSLFNKHLIIINSNEVCSKLLNNMGINKILTFDNKEVPASLSLFRIDTEEENIDYIEKAKLILTTHKELSELSEDNKEKFKSLEQILENNIKNEDK
ncbi:MAG TPA: STAS domain-containing protein [Spirochaetota bacterium]|nr:STAS domain-containing protein [Spirochaetota bacterium]HOL57890.1 STAS domain-containing protein [Spirochaetota bacterium]HPP05374.1 STAS domain-containing protein [Spirochaetota bacterium]